ncbi:hypothetical protein G3I34_04110 [Streptomyces sp. SID8014]|uniref:hypothetical protein n=1 Tax=Streptomyces sp. SID8014 TaxID=2706097 RepID=UPI0013B9F49C|nr:hypothetical protein [Streptomyces sp. SID8014]
MVRLETLRGVDRLPRQAGVKDSAYSYGPHQGCLSQDEAGVCSPWPERPNSFPYVNQEIAMADLAFVVAILAVFALVTLVARGVTKL